MTTRQPRRQPSYTNGHHDTVVRIAAPKQQPQQDSFSRFSWLIVPALCGFLLTLLAIVVGTYLGDREKATIVRTRVEQHESAISALQAQSAQIVLSVTRMEVIAKQVADALTEMQRVAAASTSDRYTGAQAASDRASVAKTIGDTFASVNDRVNRLESAASAAATSIAKFDQLAEQRKDFPERIAAIEGKQRVLEAHRDRVEEYLRQRGFVQGSPAPETPIAAPTSSRSLWEADRR